MKMKIGSLLFAAALLQACSSTEVIPGKFEGDSAKYKNAYISEVAVSSPEGNDDELAQNKTIEASARAKLAQALAEKHIATVDKAESAQPPLLVLSFKSTIDYGSRAARYFAGFGAGKGTVSSKLEASDSVTKQVLYSSSAESVLKAGVAGGSMDSIIEENIDELLAGFVNPGQQ